MRWPRGRRWAMPAAPSGWPPTRSRPSAVAPTWRWRAPAWSIPSSTRAPLPQVITDAASARSAQAQKQIEQEAAPQLEGVEDARQRKALEKRIEDRAKRTARRAQMEEVRDAVDMVALWYRDLMAAAIGADGTVVNLDLSGELIDDARRCAPGDAARAVLVVSEARRTLETNVQPALAVEAMFHRLRLAPAGS